MDNMNVCRGCLSEGVPMLSLFELYEHELTLAVILQSCIATEVFEDDNLPPYLCDKCIQTVTQFYNFTIIYEQSDQKLRSLITKPFKTEPLCEIQEQKDAAEIKSLIDNGLSVEYVKKNLIDSDCKDYSAEDDDDNEEVLSNMEDYEYYNIKNVNACETEAADEVEYIALDAIKTEKLELELCGTYSAQDTTEIRKVKEKPISRPHKLFEHESRSLETILKYECSLCGEEHLYLTAFRNHMRTKHSLFHVNPAEYSSTIQIKVAKSEPQLDELTQAHADILCGEPTLKCNVCPKKFHFDAQLNKHLKLHKMGRKFICEVCGVSFIRKTYLDDHKEGHSTERKHVCPFCGKRFRRRTVLRAHKRSHTHPNHYVCELCGRAFTSKGTLRTHHLLIHVRERNFKCMICGQKFPLKSTLNKHVVRHVKREKGEKGFNCTECEMEYRDKSSLKRHVEVKHLGNVVLVPCPECPKEYTSNTNLQKHRKKHHPTEIEAD